MTDTAALEARLRERADAMEAWAKDINIQAVGWPEDALMRQAADALAAKDAIIEKARMALEGVATGKNWVSPKGSGMCEWCARMSHAHRDDCPIGIAIGAINV